MSEASFSLQDHDMITELYPYPKGNSNYDGKGYYHHLNNEQSAALTYLQRYAIDNRIDMSLLSSYALHPSLILLRYLRANNFDVDKSITIIQNNIEWRIKMNVPKILQLNPDQILGCSLNKLTQMYPHWHCGYDRIGRPVLYKQYGKFDATTLKSFTSLDSLRKYHIWEQVIFCIVIISLSYHYYYT